MKGRAARERARNKQGPSNPWEYLVMVGPFLKQSWDDNPGKLIFLAGLILIGIGGVGKVPYLNINVMAHDAFVRIMGVGIFLFVVGAIKWSLDTKSVDKEFRFLPWFLAIVGLSYTTILLLVHLKLITAPQVLGSELDDIAVGLALASLCGFLPAYVSASTLKVRSAELRKQMKDLKEREAELIGSLKKLSDQVTETVPKTMEVALLLADAGQARFLKSLEISRKDLVNSVEDATRSMPVGFDLIFAKAYWMIDRAEEELICVNFAMNFGSVHQFNEDIKLKYETAKKQVFEPSNDEVTFENDVKHYFNRFKVQAVNIPNVQILTVTDNAARTNFLEPLSKRSGYEGLEKVLLEQLDEVKSAEKVIKANLNQTQMIIPRTSDWSKWTLCLSSC